jgi:hypothetical protein
MEATQEQGADIHSAANAILGLMGNDEPPKEEHEAEREQPQHEEPEVNPYESKEDDTGSEEEQAVHEEKSADQNPLTVDLVAQKLGITPDEVLKLSVKTKVDGVESEAKLADLLKSYQLESHLNNKSMQLSEMKKQAEAEIAQHRAYLAQQAEQGAAVLDTLQNELFREFNAIPWDDLRQADPGMYAAKRQEFEDRRVAILQAQSNFAKQIDEQVKQSQQTQQQQLQQFLESQKQAVLERLPEWRNGETAKKEGKEIADYLISKGYSEQETKQVIDARHVEIARKAMLYDKLMQAKPTVDNKVKSVPKVLKPGTSTGKAEANAARHEVKLSKLKKTGSVQDAAALFFDRL